MHEAYGGKSCLVEAVAVSFVILGGIGLVAGALLGLVSGRQGWPWWPAPALGLLAGAAYALYAIVELRGCSYDECGESAHQLALVTAFTNAGTWMAAALVAFWLARGRVTQA